MLELLRPGFLLAGALGALVPLLLHLIVRRPPERAPLPTLRFLRPDPRTAIRLRRRPADLLLLLPRMLLLLLLGAAFAEPLWRPQRTGTAEVVLLDRSAAVQGAWAPALAEAARLLLGAEGAEGEPRGTLVLFDSAATRIPRARLTPTLFDSLAAAQPGSGSPDYAVALQAIPTAAAELGDADSIRVHLLSSLRWEGWRPGLAQVRRAAWPGALHLTRLRTPESGDAEAAAPASRGRAWIIAPRGEGRFVEAALGATGWSSERLAVGSVPPEESGAFLVLGPVGAEMAEALGVRAAAGATVVYAGVLPPAGREDFPWEPERGGGSEAEGGALYFGPELVLAGAEGHFAGAPAPGALLLAAREDGRPAAAAQRRGRGCIVFLAVPLEAGTLPLTAGYPLAVDRLARGCEGSRPGPDGAGSAGGGLPLDAGALRLLRGDALPPMLDARTVSGPSDALPLARWLLLAALGVALLETLLVYARWSAR